jgi:hypothetical protein
MSVLHAGRYFCAGAVVIEIAWGAVKPRAFPANPALVRPELRDGLRVPVERFAHVELLSFTVPGCALGRDDGRCDADDLAVVAEASPVEVPAVQDLSASRLLAAEQ